MSPMRRAEESDRGLLRALNSSAAALHRSAPGPDGVFRVVLGELARLGLRGGVGVLEDGGTRVVIRGTVKSEDTSELGALQKLTGLRAKGFSFALDDVDAYRQAVESREPVVADSSDIVRQMLPAPARRFLGPVLKIFGSRTSIVTPITGRDRVLGVLSVTGRTLVAEDAPAMLAFANHIAVAYENAVHVAKIRRLSRAIEQSPSTVMITDAEGRIEYVNPKFEDLTGYCADEVLGESPSLLKSGEMPEEEYQELWHTIREGREWRGEFHNRKKNGELYWESASISAVRDADGQISHYVAVKEDITGRKRAEREREAARTLLQTTIDGVDDPIMVIGTDHQVMLMNRATRRRYGVADLVEGPLTCHGVSHERGAPCGTAECPLEQVSATLRPVTVEHTHQGEDGERRYFEVVASPLLDESGRLLGIIESSRDITDRRRMELELLRAQKLESIGVLAGGIAHDFNNLLAVMQGNVELLASNLDHAASGVGDSLADVATACKRAQDLTQQLLTFSKGGAPIKRAVAVVPRLREAARLATAGTSARCRLSAGPELWVVEADPEQLHQVVHNLVLNAAQAMPGGGQIELSACNHIVALGEHPRLAPGPHVRIRVRDEGPGIPEEHLDRIFDPYFTTKPDGSGLGLSTAFSIVDRHDGLLRVSAATAGGACFDVYLRADPAATMAPAAPAPPTCEPGVGRVLLMDDEPMIRRVATRILERAGYEVEAVADGALAVQRYEEEARAGEPFAAVILDLTVPGGMGGKEAMQQLLALDPAVKAIVCSGYSNDPVMANHRAYGFSGVVAKPYSAGELQGSVRQLLGDGE